MSILNDLGSISTNLRDRAHATKIFVDGNYSRAPKQSFLYYVNIESMSDNSKNVGVLVKSVGLPKFNIDLKKSNAYNKPSFTQTKINYEPITIVFHDDNSDTIRNFWFEYFNYYYRDTDNNQQKFGAIVKSKYNENRPSNNWGYTPKEDEPFFKKITIYSLHQKQFSAYILMNPIIKSFQHGEHQAGSNEVMQNSMTIEYESVLYTYGKITKNTVPGFLDLWYDMHPSPLTPAGGGTASILGQGGLAETADEAMNDLAEGNYGAALFKGVQGLKNASSMDLKKAATGELMDIGKNVLRGNDPTKNIFVPNLADWAGKLKGKSTSEAEEAAADNTFNNRLVVTTGIRQISNAHDNLRNQSLTADLLSADTIDTTIELGLDAADQLRAPTNQGSINGIQSKSSLQYNQNIAQQTKIALQIEINTAKDQQQLAIDAINSINNKIANLLSNGNINATPLIKQLTQQIDQQYAIIDLNENTIVSKTKLVTQLDERIKLINMKLQGIV